MPTQTIDQVTGQSYRHTTVDGETGTGHVAFLLAGEIGDQTGNLVRICGALKRNERLDRLDKIDRHVRYSWPGLNVVDCNATACQVYGNTFHHDGNPRP